MALISAVAWPGIGYLGGARCVLPAGPDRHGRGALYQFLIAALPATRRNLHRTCSQGMSNPLSSLADLHRNSYLVRIFLLLTRIAEEVMYVRSCIS